MPSNHEASSEAGSVVDPASLSPEAKTNLDQVFARLAKLEEASSLKEHFDQRMDEFDRKIEILLEMTCPVCGPKLVNRLHPEVEAEVKAVASAIRNGRHR
jgi:hypothetical protein